MDKNRSVNSKEGGIIFSCSYKIRPSWLVRDDVALKNWSRKDNFWFMILVCVELKFTRQEDIFIRCYDYCRFYQYLLRRLRNIKLQTRYYLNYKIVKLTDGVGNWLCCVFGESLVSMPKSNYEIEQLKAERMLLCL